MEIKLAIARLTRSHQIGNGVESCGVENDFLKLSGEGLPGLEREFLLEIKPPCPFLFSLITFHSSVVLQSFARFKTHIEKCLKDWTNVLRK